MNTKSLSGSRLSYRIALGGILASLCLVGMFLTGVFPMLYLLCPMLCSVMIYIMALETDTSWGLMTYFAVGSLSLFVTPSKSAGMVFLFFFGYYPLLCRKMENKRARFLLFLIRLACFNAAVMIYFWGSVYLLGAQELVESLGKYGKYGGEIMLGIANVMFLSYDYMMTLFPQVYREYLRPKIVPDSRRHGVRK